MTEKDWWDRGTLNLSKKRMGKEKSTYNSAIICLNRDVILYLIRCSTGSAFINSPLSFCSCCQRWGMTYYWSHSWPQNSVPLAWSSTIKEQNKTKKRWNAYNKECEQLQRVAFKWQKNRLTWDLDQKIKTSPTIRNSSSASGSGHVSHLALYHHKLIKDPLK